MQPAATKRDNIKFWTFLAGMILMVSVAVLLIDMSIKAAILEESNALRRQILNVREATANPDGSSDNSGDSGPVLDLNAAGMEAGNVPDGDQEKASQNGHRKPRPAPRGSRGRNLPEGN